MIEEILNQNKQIYIYAKDQNLKFLFCNEALAEVAGLDSPKQIIGKTDYDLVWRPQAEFYASENKDILRGKIYKNVCLPMTQHTKIASILYTAAILKDKNGYVKGVVGSGIDITGYTLAKNNGYIDQEKNIFYLGDDFANVYLTKREFEIFKYLLAGKPAEEIAFILDRSIKTIQSQIKHIANKLQCSHKSEIIPTAIKYGLTYVLDDIHLVKN